eukprot:380372-Rhodomonas_salina.10
MAINSAQHGVRWMRQIAAHALQLAQGGSASGHRGHEGGEDDAEGDDAQQTPEAVPPCCEGHRMSAAVEKQARSMMRSRVWACAPPPVAPSKKLPTLRMRARRNTRSAARESGCRNACVRLRVPAHCLRESAHALARASERAMNLSWSLTEQGQRQGRHGGGRDLSRMVLPASSLSGCSSLACGANSPVSQSLSGCTDRSASQRETKA